MADISNMSDKFHEWLSNCPCHYNKKYGVNVYDFYELEEEEDLE
jgi:hypothetical protein